VGQAVGLQRTPAQLVHPLEDKGASTALVLREAGFSAEEIDALVRDGVV